MKRTSFIIYLAVAISHMLSAAPVLVGHSSLEGVTLEGSSLQAVLLGKSVNLNGRRVVIVVAKNGDLEDTFFTATIKKTDKQFQNHWRRLFMTGGGSAPTEVPNESDVAAKVAETPGAIGVVDESATAGLPILARP